LTASDVDINRQKEKNSIFCAKHPVRVSGNLILFPILPVSRPKEQHLAQQNDNKKRKERKPKAARREIKGRDPEARIEP